MPGLGACCPRALPPSRRGQSRAGPGRWPSSSPSHGPGFGGSQQRPARGLGGRVQASEGGRRRQVAPDPGDPLQRPPDASQAPRPSGPDSGPQACLDLRVTFVRWLQPHGSCDQFTSSGVWPRPPLQGTGGQPSASSLPASVERGTPPSLHPPSLPPLPSLQLP